jgi:type VI secretion system secreted protein Hcp
VTQTFARHRKFLAAGLAGVTAISLCAIGIAAASSTPGLDSSVVATLVFPASAKITGSGSPAGHGANSIEVYSWSWGVSRPSGTAGVGSGAKKGRASVHDLVITKSTDQSTPALWRACASGQHYGTVRLYLDEPSSASTGAVGGGYGTYLTITLTNAFIASDTLSGTVGSGSQESPKETITFEFGQSAMNWTQGGKSATDNWESK